MSVRRLFAAGLALAAVAGCGGSPRAAAPAPDGSTLRATWVDPDGDGTLSRGPGEPLRDRTELAPAARPGRTLATLGIVTDAHVRDEESPARVPFLDRLGAPFSSTFRPQEALTAQVLDAAVRSLDAAAPDAVFELGDLLDNAQADELALATGVLDGGVVRPDSGAPGYQGPQEAANPDPAIYRPDVDPPRHPGLLDAAQRPFRAAGLRAPWYAVPGNHDLLVAGELAATARTERVAVGSRAVTALDEGVPVPRDERALTPRFVDRVLAHGLPGTTRRVAPDAARRELSPSEAVAALGRASGHPARAGRLDRVVGLGPRVRAIVLDTMRRDRADAGVVTPEQVAWLRRALRDAGDRWILVLSHRPLTRTTGGGRALALLDRDPHVLAALHGDTHRSRIEARRTPAGGFWVVGTAALADFPQQARMLRVRETAGGGAVLETWMLDTAPAPLADTARELAFLDAQGGRPDDFAGAPADRNARLFHR
jgi:3',5'-cyclic AMP phosphodiesterase CpdA